MSSQREIVGLQYLRGFAALAVVVDHAAGMAQFPKYFGQEFLSGALTRGAIGVDLFFVISGFIIAAVSLTAERQPKITVGEFFRRRFVRIIPLMWLAVISYAALRYVGRAGEVREAAYLRAMVLWPVGDLDPDVIWTLRHEFLFYSLFALTFLWSSRLKPLMWLWVAAPFAYAAFGLPLDPHGGAMEWLKFATHPVNVEFGMGLGLGLLWRSRPMEALRLPVDPAIFLPATFGALIAAVYLFGLKILPTPIGSASVLALACGAILYIGIRAECPNSLVGRAARMLGDASFAVYLFHLHLLSALLGVWSKLAPGTPVGVVIAGVALLATLGGVGIHFFVEKPVLRWIGQLWPRKRASMAGTA